MQPIINFHPPEKKLPIAIIGAGGIVKNAHLPAYKKAGFEVKAIFDLDGEKAGQLAKEFLIELVCESLKEMIAYLIWRYQHRLY